MDKKETLLERLECVLLGYCFSNSPKSLGRKYDELFILRKLEYRLIKEPLLLLIYFLVNLPYKFNSTYKPYVIRKYYHMKWWYLEKFHGKRKLRVDD